MAYKYYTVNPDISLTPQEQFTNNFQAMIDADFSTSQNYYEILEETSFASGSYVATNVRINTAISSVTGERLGDDFKRILFKDSDNDITIGNKLYFDENYWLVQNTEILKNLAIAVTAKRCNNILRWTDKNGQTYSEECSVDYNIARAIDSTSTKDPTLPEGFIKIYCQLNSDTEDIITGQRFLFGRPEHWSCFKLFGGGTQNFLNLLTSNNDSAKLLTLQLGENFVNEDTDDLTNGYADRYLNNYVLSPYPVSISGSAGNIFQIDPNVEINNINVTKAMLYSSSDADVATVSGSGGLVTLVDNGSAIISLHTVLNTSASATINVGVSASSTDYEIRIDPSSGSILESETQIFDVYSYNGGAVTSDTFVFTVSGSMVPADHYLLTTIDDNSFSVENIEKYMHDSLLIDSTSGSNVRQIEISLNGSW